MTAPTPSQPPRGNRPATTNAGDPLERGPRSRFTLAILAVLALAAFAGFVSLGTWQVERRAWKLDLIERVNARVAAPAVPAPAAAQWPSINADDNAYQHVDVTGTFQHDRETLVQAVTDLGSGFWVLTPLQRTDGTTVLINRGFVPSDKRDPASRSDTAPSGTTTVTGLLRVTEPGGGFLRKNDPAADKWYSRDVAAIAQARGLTQTAPYFIDADAAPRQGGAGFGRQLAPAGRNSPFGRSSEGTTDSATDPASSAPVAVPPSAPAGASRPPAGFAAGAALAPAAAAQEPAWPVGGLTVISFPNSHLVYAITWYGLALMVALATWYVARTERRLRRRHAQSQVQTTLRS
ncbi:SURF1 family protein [Schauerella aestuarii]|uniref:SURF1 family protein n=1 Tax=Schauerella aestuarii TaxID=2511204 RepID=UPI0013710601|nr:SURF1 family protein [Achromobacter aestuarii]MYZ44322.1 SURF1 family protein [Achromobacter aestuarii]